MSDGAPTHLRRERGLSLVPRTRQARARRRRAPLDDRHGERVVRRREQAAAARRERGRGRREPRGRARARAAAARDARARAAARRARICAARARRAGIEAHRARGARRGASRRSDRAREQGEERDEFHPIVARARSRAGGASSKHTWRRGDRGPNFRKCVG